MLITIDLPTAVVEALDRRCLTYNITREAWLVASVQRELAPELTEIQTENLSKLEALLPKDMKDAIESLTGVVIADKPLV